VTTLDALTAAVQGDDKKIVIIDGMVYSHVFIDSVTQSG